MNKSTSGFTLVELIVVIVVIGILASISVFTYSGIQEQARNTDRIATVKNLDTMVTLQYVENGRYTPPSSVPVATYGNFYKVSSSASKLAFYDDETSPAGGSYWHNDTQAKKLVHVDVSPGYFVAITYWDSKKQAFITKVYREDGTVEDQNYVPPDTPCYRCT